MWTQTAKREPRAHRDFLQPRSAPLTPIIIVRRRDQTAGKVPGAAGEKIVAHSLNGGGFRARREVTLMFFLQSSRLLPTKDLSVKGSRRRKVNQGADITRSICFLFHFSQPS